MNDIIDRLIDWEKLSLDQIAKENFKYVIGKVSLKKEEGIVIIPITLNFIIPYKTLLLIKEEIKKQIGLSDVEIQFVFDYKDVILSSKDIIRHYIPYLVNENKCGFTAFAKSINLSTFRLNGNVLTLKAFGFTASVLLTKNVKPGFEKCFRETFNLPLEIKFENDEENYIEKEKAFTENESEDLKDKLKIYSENMKEKGPSIKEPEENKFKKGEKPTFKKRTHELPMAENHVMGRAVNGTKNIELLDVFNKIGPAILEGEIIGLSFREIKTKDFISSILITDKKTTVLLKAFVSEAKKKEMESALYSGVYIIAEGEVQFDTFENINSVMVKAIDIIDNPFERFDTCDEKRVELHLHTNMSQMDGLTVASNAVKRAAKWGQKAVAITDHGVVQSFPDAYSEAQEQKKKGRPIKIIYGVEGYVFDDSDVTDENGVIDYKAKPVNHIIILAKTQAGIKSLYKLVSFSHVDYFYRKPRLPWSLIEKYRSELIIGSACVYGEVYDSLITTVYYDKKHNKNITREAKSHEEQEKIASRYDYLEIQPVINNKFLLEGEYYFEGKRIESFDDIRNVNRRVIEIGDKLGKKVVATCDTHYENEEDAIFRNILMAGLGFEDAEGGEGLFMRTTNEMLEEFSYLGDRAKEIVVDNTQYIASLVEEDIAPVPTDKCPPKIEGAEETLRTSCLKKVKEIYGDPVPKEIDERLNKELSSVIDNGYAVMYVSAKMLVDKSLSDGYLVGSRGSVGSSFAATMAGITEVNPLDPHYICPKCHHFEWGDKQKFDCGVDMPEKECPNCKTMMKRDGYMIPFATFLGFDGDKEPDIDLNFAGEYQPIAHRYVGTIFGEKNVFKAGTVSGIQDKTAYGFVKKYFEEKGLPNNKYEIDRLAQGCVGVKRTTGQHPGGIVIVPDDREIYEFCPVQHPANDTTTDVVTTHFDYHKIDKNLLKLDILGHDVPQMIRQLQNLTGVDPLTIDLTDRKVLSIFNGVEALDIIDPEYTEKHGSFAIPEFGTKFTQQMLDDIKPTKFSDLVRIAGFSHGTDVWLNNAQEYIRSGTAKIGEAISTRDDIMNYLMLKGLTPSDSFKIMEIVRKKGKVLSEDHIKLMKEHGVPDWYIDSCSKIKYMFPRGHAVAYVMMSFRMAWFKVYYPLEFYATYFTTKVQDFDDLTILKGRQAVISKLEQYASFGNNISKKDDDQRTVLEVVREMMARGYEFLPPELGYSDATKFKIKDKKVILPFLALQGVGETAAKDLCNAYNERPFKTIEEASIRASLNKTVVETLKNNGIFGNLPDTDQLSMF